MAERGSALRGWLLALMGAAVLFLAGLVLSYILWNRIESASVVPCEGHVAREVASARDNLNHAAALLGPQAPELTIGLAHIFQFPFEHAAFIAPYTGAPEIRDQLNTLWECSDDWARHVTDNDSYISLVAVTAAGVIPVRLQRTQFDLAEPTEGRFGPETALILRKRPGSDQVLIRVQQPPDPEMAAASGDGQLPSGDK